MRFSSHSNEESCPKVIASERHPGGLACMRTQDHPGDCVPEANKAGEADGVRWCCRVPLHAFHAQWCVVTPETERCPDCDRVLVPCDCSPVCPGGKCPVCP